MTSAVVDTLTDVALDPKPAPTEDGRVTFVNNVSFAKQIFVEQEQGRGTISVIFPEDSTFVVAPLPKQLSRWVSAIKAEGNQVWVCRTEGESGLEEAGIILAAKLAKNLIQSSIIFGTYSKNYNLVILKNDTGIIKSAQFQAKSLPAPQACKVADVKDPPQKAKPAQAG